MLTRGERTSLVAASGSWLLSGFDVMLYAALVPQLLSAFGMSKGQAGLLNTVMLVATGLGSYVFGLAADRLGRKRILMYSVLLFLVATAASGAMTSIAGLGICRFFVGLGMGGEWTSGAALVAESWTSERRGRAMGMVQSGYAIGYAIAVLVVATCSEALTWRGVFALGILPALFVLWIARNVEEPRIWKASRSAERPTGREERGALWKAAMPRLAVLLSMNTFGLFGWWGLFSWMPAYLTLPVEQGGRGFHAMGTVGIVLAMNLGGMVPGYLTFGGLADRLGRKKTIVAYLALAALFVPLFAAARGTAWILALGCVTAFFGSGFFVGSGTLASELFATPIRAVALGVSYNVARSLSALGPLIIGRLGERHGLSAAFLACGLAYAGATISALALPETKGRELT